MVPEVRKESGHSFGVISPHRQRCGRRCRVAWATGCTSGIELPQILGALRAPGIRRSRLRQPTYNAQGLVGGRCFPPLAPAAALGDPCRGCGSRPTYGSGRRWGCRAVPALPLDGNPGGLEARRMRTSSHGHSPRWPGDCPQHPTFHPTSWAARGSIQRHQPDGRRTKPQVRARFITHRTPCGRLIIPRLRV